MTGIRPYTRPAGANGRSRTDGSRTEAKSLQGSAEAGSRAADRSVPPGAVKPGPRAEPKADPHGDAAAPLPIAADASSA